MTVDPRLIEAAAQAIGNVVCVCGHELRRHDPEDAECDAPAIDGLGKCPCVCGRSPDPNHTLDELRAAAALEAALNVYPDCETCGGSGELTSFRPGSVPDRIPPGPTITRPCETCGGSGHGPLPLIVAEHMEQVSFYHPDYGFSFEGMKHGIEGDDGSGSPVYRLRVEDTPKPIEEGE